MAYLRSGRPSALRRGVRFFPGGQSSAAGSRFMLSPVPTFAAETLAASPNRPAPSDEAAASDPSSGADKLSS